MAVKIILALLLLTRFLLLDRIPTGINDDELHFVLDAKSFWYQGTNLYRNLSFAQSFREITTPFFAPIVGLLPSNLFTARLPYVLVGCLTVYLLYLINLKITKNIRLSITIALIAALNPWLIYVSRTSFDAPVAVFFFLLTFYLLLYPPGTGYLSLITGFVAFNAYIGTKILYFPFILISTVFLYFHYRRWSRLYSLNLIFSLLFTFVYFIGLQWSPTGRRLSELSTPFRPEIAAEVIVARNQSLQNPLKPLLTNNITQYLKNFSGKYLNNFSPDLLFVAGDRTFTGSLWQHGYFYYLDFLLIFIGIYYLYRQYSKYTLFLLAIAAIAPLPEALRIDKIPAYVFHSALLFPVLTVFAAFGLYAVYNYFQNKFLFLRFLLITVYCLLFTNFMDIYFFKSPVYQPESFAFSRRLAISALTRQSRLTDVYVLTPETDTMFRSYLFFNNLYTRSNLSAVNSVYGQSRDVIDFNRLHFINSPELLPAEKNVPLLISKNYDLKFDSSPLTIKSLGDNAVQYRLYNFTLCHDQPLAYFSHNLNFRHLAVESLSPADFCRSFITIPH